MVALPASAAPSRHRQSAVATVEGETAGALPQITLEVGGKEHRTLCLVICPAIQRLTSAERCNVCAFLWGVPALCIDIIDLVVQSPLSWLKAGRQCVPTQN